MSIKNRIKVMIEQLKIAYTQQRRVRVFVSLALLAYAALLYGLSGGFPPWAWRFLLHTLPQVSRLWAMQGSAIVVPMVGLVLLSFSLLILWGLLLVIATSIALYWWRTIQNRQRFAQDLEEAERLSDLAVRSQEFSRPISQAAQDWQPSTQPVRAPVLEREAAQSRQPVYARASRVVGSSGLLRVPNASLAAEHPTMPPSRESAVRQPVWQSVRAQAPAAPSEQPTQPHLTQQMSPAPAYSSASLREQFRIVPRVSEERVGYDTLPSFPVAPFITPDRTDNVAGDEVTTTESDDDADESVYEQETQAPASVEDERDEPIRLLVGIGLDPGIVRKDAPNEDTLFAIQGMRPTAQGPEPAGLFIVADGMGGHAHGQEASKLAVHMLSDTVVPTLLRPVDSEETFSDLLKDGVHRANLALYQRNREQERMMGTTVTSALVVASTAYIANVGDSRTYLYRPTEGLTKRTRDHSVVARLVEDGIISNDEVYTHPKRNQIYRCLGEHASVEVDNFQVALQPEDVLVLCSDGMWEMVRDDEIQRLIETSPSQPSQICNQLIQAALAHGGADNVSVIVICIASA
jgi:serine/threonine protein phosphatase PrpC